MSWEIAVLPLYIVSMNKRLYCL